MLKYFTIIAGFATLVGTSYLFLKGVAFYVAVFLSFLFAIGTVISWDRVERKRKFEATIEPSLQNLLKYVDANTVSHLVEIGKNRIIRNEVSHVLADVINAKPDPTERHWLYIALGKIGGKKAESAIKKGLSENDELVRSGAELAYELVCHDKNKRKL